MADEKPKSNPPAGMVACEVLKKLGPHQPGAKILMHQRDAVQYRRDGVVQLAPEQQPDEEVTDADAE